MSTGKMQDGARRYSGNGGFFIVSVESRKGGVGKTTAALNLARILLEKRQHAVLFLDVDITGTNATDCLDSPFWKDTCYAVPDARKAKTPANLLALFERQFMPGLGTPIFAQRGHKGIPRDKSCLLFDPDKINIIGSQIYDLGNSNKGGSGDICICKPGILFDELHAFWFIEFLQNICGAFNHAVDKDEPNKPVAVIVDNSPGYVGIAPAVQDWLTDLGPDRGKFITVSSLDKQDLLSCGHAIHTLHEVFAQKWGVSRKFIGAMSTEKNQDTELGLSPHEEGFFLRLVEAKPMEQALSNSTEHAIDISGAGLSFYLAPNVETRESYLNHPEAYQGLVINRVPSLVKRGVYTYDTEHIRSVIHRKGSDILHQLIGPDGDSNAEWMINYDESIEYQFVQPMLSRRFAKMSPRRRRLKECIHLIEERYPVPSDKMFQGILHDWERFHPELLRELHLYNRKVHESVISVIRLVDQSGFSNLTHLIHEEWLPGNIFRDFRIAVQDLLLEIGDPFVEFDPWTFEEDQFDSCAWNFLKILHHEARQHLSGLGLAQSELTEQFLPSLMAVIALSTNRRLWHPKQGRELPELFASIAAIETLHWKRRRGPSKKRLSIQRFLASEHVREKEWIEFRRKIPIHPRWIEEGGLSRLYHACASAQARLIDLQQDAEFLIALIKRLVMEDIRKSPVLPYVRGVAEKVIVRKTLSHESGRRIIAKGFSSAQYMEDFSEVLERLLTRWEGQQ